MPLPLVATTSAWVAKLAEVARRVGLEFLREWSVPDREFSFEGPASPAVIAPWEQRFERMKTVRAFLGDDYERARSDFLDALAAPAHRSSARVAAVLARKCA